MPFNSYWFIFLFLPITLGIFLFLRKLNYPKLVPVWLILASLFFYSWWNPVYVILLILSIIFNFMIGLIINKTYNQPFYHKKVLIIGIIANLCLLCYFKYAGFFVNTINDLFSSQINIGNIFLPLAISFFTLQQISYLIDAYHGEAKQFDFISYTASVTFFPHLIAGPIVRYRDLVPQFSRAPVMKSCNSTDLVVGLTIFFIGLFKKVMLGDTIAVHANTAFFAAAVGAQATFLEAWGAVMAFNFQIYFDFSGYSDMAIGLARIFGIRLPINFDSPLKAVNFIDFWRRWHITLTSFIRDYLYFPLGGSRKGVPRQYLNIMIIMLICGLWHGAGWTFVIWGGVHGLYIVINHLWLTLRRHWGHDLAHPTWYGTALARCITMAALLFSMAIFRANNLHTSWLMIKGLAGLNGVLVPELHLNLWGLGFLQPVLPGWGIQVGTISLLGPYPLEWLIFCWLIVSFMPNTQEIMSRAEPALHYHLQEAAGTWAWLRWRPTPAWALACGLLAVITVLMMAKPSPFLYFQF
jgi:alginate O-acetyltransferase complex protein AlgI